MFLRAARMIRSLSTFRESNDRGSSDENDDYTLADDRPSIKAVLGSLPGIVRMLFE